MQLPDAVHHRADIQGLRGLAVLLVIVYHTGLGLPGGFVGVDVFFVVSGFVITRLLLREWDAAGTISLRDFYARRARRLLPALAIVTVATVGLSLLVLSPFGEQQDAIAAARATALFGANLHFLRQQAYFELVDNPFRHMWSLGVEEQFYLVVPVLVLLVARAARRLGLEVRTVLGVGVLAASGVSLTASHLLSAGRGSQIMDHLVGTTPERFAFFSPATRAWEFGAGIVCALLPVATGLRDSRWWRGVALLGAAAVVGSALALDVRDRFPGTVALVPVLGTAALILGAGWDATSARMLSPRWLTWVGDRSYGWYLWHWPFVVAAGAVWPGRPWVLGVASLVALVPTAWSHARLESPIRRRADLRGRRALILGAACTAFPLVFSWPSAAGATAISRLPFEVRDAWSANWLATDRGCFGDPSLWTTEGCVLNGTASGMVALVGDSQAASWSESVMSASDPASRAMITQPGCAFLSREAVSGCISAIAAARSLLEQVAPDVVVIANAATRYTWDGQVIPRSTDAGGGLPRSVEERRTTYVDAYVNTVQSLVDGGRRVVVLLEVPTMTFSKRVSLLRPNPRPRTTPLADQVDRNEIARMLQERLGRDDRVSIVDPAPILCPDGTCSPIVAGKWAYMEASHLNPYGASLLVEELRSAIREQLARALD
jgi:peptidoglycan/LPS O-acetylase OafA/YrhL